MTSWTTSKVYACCIRMFYFVWAIPGITSCQYYSCHLGKLFIRWIEFVGNNTRNLLPIPPIILDKLSTLGCPNNCQMKIKLCMNVGTKKSDWAVWMGVWQFGKFYTPNLYKISWNWHQFRVLWNWKVYKELMLRCQICKLLFSVLFK